MPDIREIIVKEYRDENDIFVRQDIIAGLVRCTECKHNQGKTPCWMHIKGVEWCSLGKK